MSSKRLLNDRYSRLVPINEEKKYTLDPNQFDDQCQRSKKKSCLNFDLLISDVQNCFEGHLTNDANGEGHTTTIITAW